jgi:hypothetical protein
LKILFCSSNKASCWSLGDGGSELSQFVCSIVHLHIFV